MKQGTMLTGLFRGAVLPLVAMAWVANATAARQDTPAPRVNAATATTTFADRLEAARNLGCPSGLEHMLPGIYYYCVGARELARGHATRGVSMLELAAGWGSKPAQLTLGVAYYNGDALPRERARGLAWLGLAAERHDPYNTAIFKSAWDKATPPERQLAQALWRAMQPTYADERAAHRAELRYNNTRMELMRNDAYGSSICVAGLTTSRVVQPDLDPGNPYDPENYGCGGAQSVNQVARITDAYADLLFEGWHGHVSIGPVQQVAPEPGKQP